MRLLRWLPRFQQAYRALGELQQREGWSRTQIEAWQLERLNAVWSHAILHVPHYRHLARQRGLPPRFTSLEDYRAVVPLLPREKVSADNRAFLSEQAAPGRWARTSGSTGTTLSVYWSHAAHREMLRAKYRFHASWGVDIFDRGAFLWGGAMSMAPGWKAGWARLVERLHDRLRNRIRLSAYHLGPRDLQRDLDWLLRIQPVQLYGYSTAVTLLANEALAQGVKVDSLRLIVMTSESVSLAMREQVTRAFDVPVAVEYGSVEGGFLACEGPEGLLRVREDGVFVETLPRLDGRYDVVVSVLNNPSFPLLRYLIGDVVDAPLSFPEQGFALLPAVVGRAQDHLLTRSGRRIHAFLLYDVFEPMPEVRRWRMHQDRSGALTVSVELNHREKGHGLDLPRLTHRLEELLEGYPVRIEIVPNVYPALTGKHRRVLSELVSYTSDGDVSESLVL